MIAVASQDGERAARVTHADKRRRVLQLIADEPSWSNRRIAAHCGVTHPFVAKVRAEAGQAATAQRAQQRQRSSVAELRARTEQLERELSEVRLLECAPSDLVDALGATVGIGPKCTGCGKKLTLLCDSCKTDSPPTPPRRKKP